MDSVCAAAAIRYLRGQGQAGDKAPLHPAGVVAVDVTLHHASYNNLIYLQTTALPRKNAFPFLLDV